MRAHPGADPYEEGALLLEDEGVGSVTVNEATRSQVDSMLSRMDYIVAVGGLCAGALAFIVHGAPCPSPAPPDCPARRE